MWGKVKYLLIRLLKYWQHVIDHMLVQQLHMGLALWSVEYDEIESE